MVEIVEKYISQLCRACLSESKELYPLFVPIENVNVDLAAILSTFSIEVENNENLPEAVCLTCFNAIINFYNFHETFKASQTMLVQEGKTEQEEELQEVNVDNNVIKVEIDEDIHTCPVCNQTITDWKRFSKHLKKFHNQSLIMCQLCEIELETDEFLKHYQKSHNFANLESVENITIIKESESETVMCDLCGKEFDQDEFLEHCNSKHKKKRRQAKYNHICPVCEKAFRDVSVFLRHVQKHKSSDLKCSVCHSDFSKIQDFVEHYKENHKKKLHIEKTDEGDKTTKYGRSKYNCPICKKPLFSFQSFSKHILNHKTCTISCTNCNEQFEENLKFLEHYRISHRFECEICNCSFQKNEQYQRHLQEHDNNYDPTYVCTYKHCLKRFFTATSLTRHKAKHEDNKSLYSCKFCNETFTSYDTMRYHTKKHLGPSHLCMYCGKAYFQAVHLKYHMWRHTGVKPYQCDKCTKMFVTKKLLTNHLKKSCSKVNEAVVLEEQEFCK